MLGYDNNTLNENDSNNNNENNSDEDSYFSMIWNFILEIFGLEQIIHHEFSYYEIFHILLRQFSHMLTENVIYEALKFFFGEEVLKFTDTFVPPIVDVFFSYYYDLSKFGKYKQDFNNTQIYNVTENFTIVNNTNLEIVNNIVTFNNTDITNKTNSTNSYINNSYVFEDFSNLTMPTTNRSRYILSYFYNLGVLAKDFLPINYIKKFIYQDLEDEKMVEEIKQDMPIIYNIPESKIYDIRNKTVNNEINNEKNKIDKIYNIDLKVYNRLDRIPNFIKIDVPVEKINFIYNNFNYDKNIKIYNRGIDWLNNYDKQLAIYNQKVMRLEIDDFYSFIRDHFSDENQVIFDSVFKYMYFTFHFFNVYFVQAIWENSYLISLFTIFYKLGEMYFRNLDNYERDNRILINRNFRFNRYNILKKRYRHDFHLNNDLNVIKNNIDIDRPNFRINFHGDRPYVHRRYKIPENLMNFKFNQE